MSDHPAQDLLISLICVLEFRVSGFTVQGSGFRGLHDLGFYQMQAGGLAGAKSQPLQSLV